jgi:hypothetical protein
MPAESQSLHQGESAVSPADFRLPNVIGIGWLDSGCGFFAEFFQTLGSQISPNRFDKSEALLFRSCHLVRFPAAWNQPNRWPNGVLSYGVDDDRITLAIIVAIGVHAISFRQKLRLSLQPSSGG